MRSFLVLIAVAAAGVWVAIRYLPASEARAAHQTVRVQEVQSVAIDGGRGLPLAALRNRLTTRPGQLLDAGRLEQDRRALEDELASRGRLAAKVEPAAVTFGAAGGAFVTYVITQGPMFKVRTVTVVGASERDAGVVTLAAGDEALADRIERARQTLAENLERRGKSTEVTVTVRSDLEAAAVDIELATTN